MVQRNRQSKIHITLELTENEMGILGACQLGSGKTESEVVGDALMVLYMAIPREGESVGRAAFLSSYRKKH